MKTILTLLFAIFSFIFSNAQDIIYLKESGKLDVKIIKEDKSHLLFYMTNDTTKSIRKVSLNVISKYEYNSKNDLSTYKSDSLLLDKYAKQIEINILNPDVINEETNNIVQEYKLEKQLNTNPAVKHFTRARNHFGFALLTMAVSSVITSITASTLPPFDTTDPKYLEKYKAYSNRVQTLQYMQYGALGISTAFSISSAMNVFDGLIELAKLKQ